MRFLSCLSTLLFATTAVCAPTCTSTVRREGLRSLVKAFISGTDADIAQVPLADNITSIIQTQGIRVILGKDLEGAKRAIKLVHTITTGFGPAPDDLDQYFDNSKDEAFLNGTANVGLTLGGVRLPLVKSPATQNLKYDIGTCKGYEAVGTVEPVDGVVQTALETFLLQNFPLYEVLDNTKV